MSHLVSWLMMMMMMMMMKMNHEGFNVGFYDGCKFRIFRKPELELGWSFDEAGWPKKTSCIQEWLRMVQRKCVVPCSIRSRHWGTPNSSILPSSTHLLSEVPLRESWLPGRMETWPRRKRRHLMCHRSFLEIPNLQLVVYSIKVDFSTHSYQCYSMS